MFIRYSNFEIDIQKFKEVLNIYNFLRTSIQKFNLNNFYLKVKKNIIIMLEGL